MMIRTAHLTRTYPGAVPVHALNDVTLEVKQGELIAIMGRSGSGKSTFLHQIGLIDVPTSGSLEIDGIDVLTLSDQQKTEFRLSRLGFIFQEYALIPELTALENVFVPALAKGVSSRTYHADARELLRRVGLENRTDHYPHELSGGEQQRVAIARALINKPKVLLADEPTANLDTAAAREVLELFRELNKELGQTVLMITHEPEDRAYVERVIWLSDGRLEKIEKIPKSTREMRRVLSTL